MSLGGEWPHKGLSIFLSGEDRGETDHLCFHHFPPSLILERMSCFNGGKKIPFMSFDDRLRSDLFPHTNEAWNESENIWIDAHSYLLLFIFTTYSSAFHICAMQEWKIRLGSLEPCSLNAVWSKRLETCPMIAAFIASFTGSLQSLAHTHTHPRIFAPADPSTPMCVTQGDSQRWRCRHEGTQAMSICLCPPAFSLVWPLQPVAMWPTDPWLDWFLTAIKALCYFTVRATRQYVCFLYVWNTFKKETRLMKNIIH